MKRRESSSFPRPRNEAGFVSGRQPGPPLTSVYKEQVNAQAVLRILLSRLFRTLVIGLRASVCFTAAGHSGQMHTIFVLRHTVLVAS
jgi:hypothetical protein